MLVKIVSDNGSGAATSLGGIVTYFNQGDTTSQGIYLEIPDKMIANLNEPLLQVYSAFGNYVTVFDWVETSETNIINGNTINYTRYTWDVKINPSTGVAENMFGPRHIRLNFN